MSAGAGGGMGEVCGGAGNGSADRLSEFCVLGQCLLACLLACCSCFSREALRWNPPQSKGGQPAAD
jgi:hypothetical protein